ncbi:immunity 49 family protein [Corallococcus sp. CA047B]|uniref:immunity 49 family protein n=1 Tax=Corallococcus sp. CA047B TaxID=2316729 RepID=UPI001315530A|nr:immunity 49 family protein [Corallococcus sp. CA047B]
MSLKTLEFTLRNLGTLLVRHLDQLSEPDPSKLLELSTLYRRIGIGHLLAHHDVREFAENLFSSAETYLMLLRTQEPGAEGPRSLLARSRGVPLLDALCLGAWDLARDIDGAMPATWWSDVEEEEAFLYFKLLPALIDGKVDPGDARKLAALLEAEGTARLRAVDAVLRADERAFEDSLRTLTDDWRIAIEQDRETRPVDPYHDHTEAQVFIEGAALVRLARLRGLKAQERYDFIPASILRDLTQVLPSSVMG